MRDQALNSRKKIPNNMPGVSVKRSDFAWAFGGDLVSMSALGWSLDLEAVGIQLSRLLPLADARMGNACSSLGMHSMA